jgi:hypothetical protein
MFLLFGNFDTWASRFERVIGWLVDHPWVR